jgi:hypothetical protein
LAAFTEGESGAGSDLEQGLSSAPTPEAVSISPAGGSIEEEKVRVYVVQDRYADEEREVELLQGKPNDHEGLHNSLRDILAPSQLASCLTTAFMVLQLYGFCCNIFDAIVLV